MTQVFELLDRILNTYILKVLVEKVGKMHK